MPSATPLAEVSKTASALEEPDFGLGFLPGTALYDAPYPFPSSTSYPGPALASQLEESTKTATPLIEA